MENCEQSWIGAVLSIHGNRVIESAIAEGFRPEMLSDSRHRIIAEVALDLWGRRKPVDFASVSDAAGDRVEPPYLTSCLDNCPTSAHADYYLDQVMNAYLGRNARQVMASAMETLDGGPVDVSDVIAAVQNDLFSLRSTPCDGQHIGDVASALLEQWTNQRDDDSDRITWPLTSLQRLIGSIADEYVVLASQPSIGKTALALQLATHAARRGVTVAMASLESKKPKIAQRLLAHVGQCRTLAMRRGAVAASEWTKAASTADTLKTLPLRIDDRPMTVDQLRAWGLREKSNGAGILIIDNMRHIRSTSKFKNRFDLFAELSLQLKFLRDDTGIPVMALHHLSAEDRLAWSADIERDADLILVLSKDVDRSEAACPENSWCERSFVTLNVQKNREGNTGAIAFEFLKDVQTFIEVTDNVKGRAGTTPGNRGKHQ